MACGNSVENNFQRAAGHDLNFAGESLTLSKFLSNGCAFWLSEFVFEFQVGSPFAEAADSKNSFVHSEFEESNSQWGNG
jgi:hypothetical protein